MENREASITPPPKPILLSLAMIFFACFSAVTLMILPAALLAPAGRYSINDQAVTRAEFFARTGALLYSTPFLAAYAGLIAYAIYDERSWSRTLLAAYFPICGVISVLSFVRLTPMSVRDLIALEVLEFTVLSFVAWWYLYRKRYVAEYYRSIANVPRR